MTTVNYGEYTTMPHPWKKAHRHGADDGQVGWKLHVVPCDEQGVPEKLGQALCGLRPRHGWGLDLFIEDECSRCNSIMEKRKAEGVEFVDIPQRNSEARKLKEHQEFLEQEKKEGRA